MSSSTVTSISTLQTFWFYETCCRPPSFIHSKSYCLGIFRKLCFILTKQNKYLNKFLAIIRSLEGTERSFTLIKSTNDHLLLHHQQRSCFQGHPRSKSHLSFFFCLKEISFFLCQKKIVLKEHLNLNLVALLVLYLSVHIGRTLRGLSLYQDNPSEFVCPYLLLLKITICVHLFVFFFLFILLKSVFKPSAKQSASFFRHFVSFFKPQKLFF